MNHIQASTRLLQVKQAESSGYLPYLLAAGGLAAGGAAMYKHREIGDFLGTLRWPDSGSAPAGVPTPHPNIKPDRPLTLPKWQAVAAGMIPIGLMQHANVAYLNAKGKLTGNSPGYMHELAQGVRDRIDGLVDPKRVRIPDMVMARPGQSAFAFGPAQLTDRFGFKTIKPGWQLRASADTGPEILAHEAGHGARGAAASRMLNILPKYLNLGGMLGGLATDDENKSLALSAGGSAAGAVTTMDEILASRRGSQLLRSIPTSTAVPNRVFRGTYRGVPSYALSAALPLVLHYLRKQTGGFSPQ